MTSERRIKVALKYGNSTKFVSVDAVDKVSILSDHCEGRKIFFLAGEAEVPLNAMFSSLNKDNKDQLLITAYKEEEFKEEFEKLSLSMVNERIIKPTHVKMPRTSRTRSMADLLGNKQFMNQIRPSSSYTRKMSDSKAKSIPICPSNNRLCLY